MDSLPGYSIGASPKGASPDIIGIPSRPQLPLLNCTAPHSLSSSLPSLSHSMTWHNDRLLLMEGR